MVMQAIKDTAMVMAAMKKEAKSITDPIGGLPGTALRRGINAKSIPAIIPQAAKCNPFRHFKV